VLQRVKELIKIFMRQVHRRHHNNDHHHHHHRIYACASLLLPHNNTLSFKCFALHRQTHQQPCAVTQNRTTFMSISPAVSDPSGRAVYGVGLGPLARCDCRFESRWEHGCLPPVSVVLSGRKFCDGLFSRPGESYQMWCV